MVAEKPEGFAWLMAICLPAFAIGWRLHKARLYQLVYLILTATSLKLLWDGVSGLAGGV